MVQKRLARGRQSLQLGAEEMPVGNDIAKRFEQLETQWLSFQRKAATKRDETAASLGSTPHLLSSPQERLEDAEPASRKCSTFTFPVAADHQACLEMDGASGSRGGAKAARVRARSSALAPLVSGSPRSAAFSERGRNPVPSYSSLRQAHGGSTTLATPASTVSGVGARDAAVASPGGAQRERGTVYFVGYSGRAPNPACRSTFRASLADQQRAKASIAQHRCSSNGGRRAELGGSTAVPPSPDLPAADEGIHNCRTGYNGRKPCAPHLSLAGSQRHVDVKRYLRGDVCTSTPAASDPATYSSGKGPPLGDDRVPTSLDCRDSPPMATSLPADAPSPDKDLQCRVGGSFEAAHSKRSEKARSASPWDKLGYLAADDEGDGQDFEGIENAMISDVQEIEQLAKPRSAKEPQNHFRQHLLSQKLSATQEQGWKKSRQKQDKVLADASSNALETGKAVLRKLLSCLKDVLQQFEQKDKSLQQYWHSLAQSRRLSSVMKSYASACGTGSMQLDNLWLLAEEASPDNWSRPVIGICERLVSLFGRETHLQKWAVALERETVNLMRMEAETSEMKAVASKEAERVSALERLVHEKCHNVEEERINLAKERETLSLWVGHLQERRKAVSECEKEAAASLAEVQKRSANLFVRESAIDGRALEIATLQEEVRIVSQRLHDDLEVITKEKIKIQEKLRQVLVKEGDVETQTQALSKMQQDLQTQTKQLERERLLGEEEKQKTCAIFRDKEEKLILRESTLQSLQKQIEEAKVEAENARQHADNARACVWEDRREADEYITSMDTRLREWEGELTNREIELLQKQEYVRELEKSVTDKQSRYQLLHQKVLEEQKKMSDELDQRELTLAKRTALQDQNYANVTNELDKLRDERESVYRETQLLTEMESRVCTVSKGLQAKHDELLEQVREDAKQYSERMEELEAMKWSLKSESIRGFEELSLHKQALRIWQNELEGSLEEQIRNMVKDKADLEVHVQRLNTMQLEMERVGSQVIEHIQVLEQTASKLEQRQQKVELAHSSVKESAVKLMKQQDCLLQREASLHAKESNLLETQNQLKQLAIDAQTHELALKEMEMALITGENNLQVMEGKLEDERKNFKERVLRFKQHVANLERKAANTEETLRTQAEAFAQKERALTMEKLSLLKGVADDSSTEEEMFKGTNKEFTVRERERRALEGATKNVEESNVVTCKGSRDEQGGGSAQKEAVFLSRDRGASNTSEQHECRSGHGPQADEWIARRCKSDLQGQHPDMPDIPLQAGGESFDAGSAGKKLDMGETGHAPIAGTDQRGHHIRDFWQRLRSSGLRTELDRIGAEERKRAIESLLTSLSKTDMGRGTGNKERTNGGKDRHCKPVDFAAESMDDEEFMRKQGQQQESKTTANFLSTLSGQLARNPNLMYQISSRPEIDSILEHQEVGEAAEGSRPALMSTNHFKDDETAMKQHKTMALGTGEKEDTAEALAAAFSAHQISESLEGILKNETWSRDRNANSEVAGCEGNYREESSAKPYSQHNTSRGTPREASREASIPHPPRPFSQGVETGISNFDSPGVIASANPVASGFSEFGIGGTGGHAAKLPHGPKVRSFCLEGKLSSQQRLEAVMFALQQASQESRSRLLEARQRLRRLPSSVASASQAQAALEDLSRKLTLMEQIEDGLASQLEKACLLPVSSNTVDQAYVDRVQLLDRLEEQQRLRSEWDEDMQQHMDSIDPVLQGATSHNSPQQLAGSINWSHLRTPMPASRNHPVPWQILGSSGLVHKSPGSVADCIHGSVHNIGSYAILEQSRAPLPQRNSASSRAGDLTVERAYAPSYQDGGATDFKSLAMSSRRKLRMSPLQNMYGLFTK